MITDPTETISIPPKTFTDAFTQSELGTWDQCAYKWYLQYAHRLEPVTGWAKPLVLGTAIHATLANFYRGDSTIAPCTLPEGGDYTLEDEKDLEFLNVIEVAMMEIYFEYYADDLKIFKFGNENIEQVVEVEFEYKGVVIKLKGTLDLIQCKLKQLIIDHKSAFRLDESLKDSWRMKFQFMFYVWLAFNSPTFRQKSPAKFMVNGIKKPELRVKKDESLSAFGFRIREDMRADPLKYFWREEMDFNLNTIKRFENEHLFPKLDRIVALQEESFENGKMDKNSIFLAINKNTDACYNFNKPCAFLSICKSSFVENVDKYKQRQEKHSNYITIEVE
jgi:hypothetical protein